ncbi:beta-galactosidase [Streptomyces sp. 378]|uniref:beta-galactosidase n=1 Tax=Streptomyces sp. 378 TaxID=3049412 RepID=UPI0024C41A50|nr:beta-galactosidase [Streptomyces sp. 378]MDK1344380.1 beta-galactosidase [Streptomyces sp. 378]
MTPKIRYGGDYNPEQWPREVWDEDHRLFTRSGIDTLTVDRPSRNRGRRPGSSSGSSSRGEPNRSPPTAPTSTRAPRP